MFCIIVCITCHHNKEEENSINKYIVNFGIGNDEIEEVFWVVKCSVCDRRNKQGGLKIQTLHQTLSQMTAGN